MRRFIICTLHHTAVAKVITLQRIKWVGHIAHWREENAYRILAGKPEGEGYRYTWDSNIKMDLEETGYEDTD
jgi:hypothetical protein